MRHDITPKLFALVGAFVLAASLPRAASAQSPDDILVVANKAVPVNTLTLDEVRAMFLKRRVTWAGGLSAVPINTPSGTALRVRFAKAVLELSTTEESRYWEDQKVKRGVVAPPVFENTLKAVYKIKGGVSYVLRQHYKDGVVKVLLTLPASK